MDGRESRLGGCAERRHQRRISREVAAGMLNAAAGAIGVQIECCSGREHHWQSSRSTLERRKLMSACNATKSI